MRKYIDDEKPYSFEFGEEIVIKDRWKRECLFKILLYESPTGFFLEARESKRDESPGHEFNLFLNFDEDIEFGKILLIRKIKRGLNRRHLIKEDGKWEIGKKDMLRGRIAWNDDFSDTKYDRVFVIDGKRITMEEFGEMFERWEGWHFKFRIVDRFDSDA
jgi:hypothetical protein